MLTTPRYSRVGDRRVDCKIETSDLKMPKNSPLDDIPHGCYTSYVVLETEQVITKLSPFSEKELE